MKAGDERTETSGSPSGPKILAGRKTQVRMNEKLSYLSLDIPRPSCLGVQWANLHYLAVAIGHPNKQDGPGPTSMMFFIYRHLQVIPQCWQQFWGHEFWQHLVSALLLPLAHSLENTVTAPQLIVNVTCMAARQSVPVLAGGCVYLSDCDNGKQ